MVAIGGAKRDGSCEIRAGREHQVLQRGVSQHPNTALLLARCSRDAHTIEHSSSDSRRGSFVASRHALSCTPIPLLVDRINREHLPDKRPGRAATQVACSSLRPSHKVLSGRFGRRLQKTHQGGCRGCRELRRSRRSTSRSSSPLSRSSFPSRGRTPHRPRRIQILRTGPRDVVGAHLDCWFGKSQTRQNEDVETADEGVSGRALATRARRATAEAFLCFRDPQIL